jgi:hypothetical protein
MITYKSKNRAFAAVLAGTAIATTCSASAAPVLTNTAAVRQALASDVQEVRWRGGRVIRLGGPLAGGLLAGGLISTAVANPCCYDYASYPNPYAPLYVYAYPAYGYDERGAAWWRGVGWRDGWGPGWGGWR